MSIKKILSVIFPMMFVLVGAGFLYVQGLSTIKQYIRQQQFIQVEASVKKADLKWEESWSDSIKYTIDVIYQYENNGNIYEIEREIVETGDLSNHELTKSRKEQAVNNLNNSRIITLSVDPNNPTRYQGFNQIDTNEFMVSILVPAVFILVGLFVTFRILKSKKPIEKKLSRPWMEIPAWKENNINCDTISRQKGSMTMAVFWILFSFTAFGLFISQQGFENPYFLLVGIFPVIGIFLLYGAISEIKNLKKYGTACIELDPFPASIGGHFGGIIKFKKTLPDESTIEVKLTCVKVEYSGSGKNRKKRKTLLWETTGFAYLSMRKNEAKIRLEIPDHLKESSISSTGIHWNAICTVSYDDDHFSRHFKIPVYRTNENSSIDVDSKNHPDTKKHASELINEVTEFTKRGEEYLLRFPALRILKKQVAIGLAIGAALLGAVIVSILYGSIPIIMLLFMSFFGLIFFGLAAFEGGYTLYVILSPHKITTEHKWLGRSFKNKNIPASSIHKINIEDYTRTSSNERGLISYYKITVADETDKNTAIAIRLKARSTAEEMKSFFENYYKINGERNN
ncbi:DUF3592 domain-containing protein [Mangrovivirga cuniculi]|uniref:DUF3592 domain-containing protein n=1 Tax=Mangrovivirga cuniculi TaxID=2715131 RepID=A0A4D7JQN0_9BACT|nr:DUF3592 domain-containing protein [Mangrovivirga cuniculi]QCK15800.1 hypothetical protein DCC35_14120 [Mangrovivirga cuniculi]